VIKNPNQIVRIFFYILVLMSGTKQQDLKKNLLISTVFAVAMAYLESTVVVYLREIFYPHGFKFPLIDIPPDIYLIEVGREAATILMLWAVSGILQRNRREWFAYFAYNFAVWDIWYYLWLKIMLGWPASMLDWDVLFLIPLPWISPVLAPVLVSSALIFSAVVILTFESTGHPLNLTIRDWVLEILAGIIIIGSFLTQTEVIAAKQVPQSYPWGIFTLGMILGLAVFIFRLRERLKLGSDPG